MQESPNPLAPKPVLQPKPSNLDDVFGVPKQVWLIAGILVFLIVIAYLGYIAWDKSRSLKDATAKTEEVQAAKVKNDTELADLKLKLAQYQGQIEALQREKAATVQSHKSLEEEMRAALESRDVTISKLQGKLTVNILDRILFESGEAELKSDGEAVLMKVGAILKQHPQLKVHVIGHTDNVPIRAGARNRFPSNWELSTARATAAVRFLSEQAGVNPTQLGALGYGEFRPVADNNTKEGRAKNRRIAITILSDELAGADAPAPPPAVSTNAAVAPVAMPVATNHAHANSNGHAPVVTNTAPTTNPAASPATNAVTPPEEAADTNTPASE